MLSRVKKSAWHKLSKSTRPRSRSLRISNCDSRSSMLKTLRDSRASTSVSIRTKILTFIGGDLHVMRTSTGSTWRKSVLQGSRLAALPLRKNLKSCAPTTKRSQMTMSGTIGRTVITKTNSESLMRILNDKQSLLWPESESQTVSRMKIRHCAASWTHSRQMPPIWKKTRTLW